MHLKCFIILTFEILILLIENATPYGHNSGAYQRYKKDNSKYKSDRSKCEPDVLLPTGNRAHTSDPYMPNHWKCGAKSILIPTKQREFNMIKNEVENTWGWYKNFPHKIVKIERIFNACLWDKYRRIRSLIKKESGTANEMFLFHGSPAVSQIVHTGLDERYGKISGWFGAGLYFASHAAKSNGFIKALPDGSRELLLCRVALGNMKVVSQPTTFAHAPKNYNSVKGDCEWPEYVVYKGEQAYPEYLITYK